MAQYRGERRPSPPSLRELAFCAAPASEPRLLAFRRGVGDRLELLGDLVSRPLQRRLPRARKWRPGEGQGQ